MRPDFYHHLNRYAFSQTDKDILKDYVQPKLCWRDVYAVLGLCVTEAALRWR
eukprot:NODE_5282_length_596_cov_1.035120.p5 GENE.NODE_5282_length_596_cov_1.035120~~NODE_5282_length_596_cov_1.035120.p5  ORF type:complete len:52 (-),score=8.52 NODE_5282_length_596_cov_1.035120:383-538(-)